MRRKTRAAGWGLVALATVTVAAIVTVGALLAHGDAAFNRWVGWATVAAVPIAALGIVLVVGDKITASGNTPEADSKHVEDELAAVVLAQAQVARSRLIGAGEPGDQAANTRFAKSGGRFRQVGGAIVGNLSSVLEYYQSLSPRRLVVQGEPGSGKTVLVLELQVRLLEARQHDSSIPVPVLIGAAAYDTRMSWEEWLKHHIAERFAISVDVAARLVRDGHVLPLVDGIDEMGAPEEPERAKALIAALNAWMSGREKAAVVATCRGSEYRSLARGVDRATHVEMLPLSGTEAAAYLGDQFLNLDEQRRWSPVIAALNAAPHGALARQLATPWRLTLALAAFRDEGDPSSLLPPSSDLDDTIAQKYVQRLESLLLGSYVSAAVRLHDVNKRYTEKNVQRWLTALAEGLAWRACHDQSATDIRLDQWWQPTVAWFAQIVTSAVPGLPYLIAIAVKRTLRPYRLAWRHPTVTLIIRGPSVDQLKGLRGLHLVIIGIVFAFTIGFEFGFFLGFEPRFYFMRGLVTGLALGLACAVMMGFWIAFEGSPPQALAPRDVIRRDRGRMLGSGLVTGLATGLAIGLIFGFWAGLGAGLVAGLVFGPLEESAIWARYRIGILIAAVQRRGPLRFGAFLDWAQQAGLLRVSGIAYQFRHRQLQDWLTSSRGRGCTRPRRAQ